MTEINPCGAKEILQKDKMTVRDLFGHMEFSPRQIEWIDLDNRTRGTLDCLPSTIEIVTRGGYIINPLAGFLKTYGERRVEGWRVGEHSIWLSFRGEVFE